MIFSRSQYKLLSNYGVLLLPAAVSTVNANYDGNNVVATLCVYILGYS
jgi:hypothetical protein